MKKGEQFKKRMPWLEGLKEFLQQIFLPAGLTMFLVEKDFVK